MRAVVTRVDGASVSVTGTVVASVDGPALLALVGVTHTDDRGHAERLASKLAHLRILAGERSVIQAGAPVLLVSQFTLYGDTRRGRRPSWGAAAPGPVAEPLVTAVATGLSTLGVQVESGVFGAHMRLSSVNDGPFTVLIET